MEAPFPLPRVALPQGLSLAHDSGILQLINNVKPSLCRAALVSAPERQGPHSAMEPAAA